MPQINAERLLADLKQLRRFGATGDGVVRPSLSPTDMKARRWLLDTMAAAALDAKIDGVGNVIGRAPRAGKALLIGSHSDTQPTGGWLDGALGTIYAIEVVRALRDDPTTRDFPVDAVALIDEESTFLSFLGSRALMGRLTRDEILGARSDQGQTLVDAFAEAGVTGLAEPLDLSRYGGFLEAHIEQGPFLEREGNIVGIVSGIVGSANYTVHFQGQQNHAGTTPMNERRDAGMTLIEFAHAINEAYAGLAGEKTVWTIGQVEFNPGARSIVPGAARMALQFRDPEASRLGELEAVTERLTQQFDSDRVRLRLEPLGQLQPPVAMSDEFQRHLQQSAERHAPGKWKTMPSAALHDAAVFADKMPAAMLFIPSIDGISHDFAENSHEGDIVLGCQVLADAAASIASRFHRA